MNAPDVCPSCGASLEPGRTPCPACGSVLAGMREVAREPLREEAVLAHDLLLSAGFHPAVAYEDESDAHHSIDPAEPFTSAAGLMLPVTVAFVVYVPDTEADEARRVLEDASQAGLSSS